MKHDTIEAGLGHAPCRYGSSRLLFRGPKRPLDGRHIAFVGGTETFGRLLPEPFPALVEELVGEPCVNFGQVNASVDAFLADPIVPEACRDAVLTVVELTGAHNVSNRFYSVHARRNDRFLRASSVFRAVYPEVDLADACFTRHLLQKIQAEAPERFHILREELQVAWLARMRSFLRAVGPRVLLLWLSPHLPSDAPWEGRAEPLARDPLFVTRRMIDQLRPLVRGVVMVQPSPAARREAAHHEAARALAASIRPAIA